MYRYFELTQESTFIYDIVHRNDFNKILIYLNANHNRENTSVFGLVNGALHHIYESLKISCESSDVKRDFSAPTEHTRVFYIIGKSG